jgi:hypothetical protein
MTLPELEGVLAAVGKLLPARRASGKKQEPATTHYKSLRRRRPDAAPAA